MRNIVLSALISCVMITGCSKDREERPATGITTTPRISSVRQTISENLVTNLTEEYIYDDDNKRLRELRIFDGNQLIRVHRYSVESGKLLKRVYNGKFDEITAELEIITANDGGYIGETITPVNRNVTQYQYNSKNYPVVALLKYNNTLEGRNIYYYSGDNRLDSIVWVHPTDDNDRYAVNIFSYYTDKKNTTGSINQWLIAAGVPQQYALKKMTRYSYIENNVRYNRVKVSELDYDHTLDSEGRIQTTSISETSYQYRNLNEYSTFFKIKSIKGYSYIQ